MTSLGEASVGGSHRARWAITAAQMRQLIQVALGEAKADLVIRDGDLVNVYTGELQERCAVVVKGDRVAYVGRDYQNSIGPETQVIDATGKTIVPGFLDGHTHLLNRYAVEEFVRYTIPTGTTTVISEILELIFFIGLPAIPGVLAAFDGQPIKIFATLPGLATIDPPWPGIAPTVEEYAPYLAEDNVLGIGETYWANVLREDGRLLEIFAHMHGLRKSLEGHTAGARGNRLQAYVATGQTSCHEPIAVDEAVERLRLGMHVMLRQGAVRNDLAGVAAIKDSGLSLRRLVVCSDSLDPAELMAGRYMNSIVQGAIDLGFDPITAIQMASLNVAEHFHLDYWLGALAPGRFADLSIVPDLRHIEPEGVLSNGRLVAREGKALVSPRPVRYPAAFHRSVHLPRELRAADFRVAAPANGSTCPVRAIRQITELVTQQGQYDLPVRDGELAAQPAQDVIKVAAIERRKGEGERFIGFLNGHGLQRGAFATTMTWDSTAMIVVGAADADMALAVNHLAKLQGGAVVCAAGKVLAELPATVGGFVSELPMPEIVAAMAALQDAAAALGSVQPRQLLSLDTLTTAAIPHFRINHVGYYSLREGKAYGLFV